MSVKWRVERCGSLSSGYAPGWIAMDADAEHGAYFATHPEALDFAHRMATAALDRDSRRALMKLTSRGVPAAGISTAESAPKIRRPYRKITDGEIRAARAMRDNGRTWAEIASTLGVKKPSLYAAVMRENGSRA